MQHNGIAVALGGISTLPSESRKISGELRIAVTSSLFDISWLH
jgi:hypothetical protein